MQAIRRFEGALDGANTQAFRSQSPFSTATVNTNVAKTELLNQCMADFLKNDCGVDAAYEARGDDPNKYLWIWDAPTLLADVVSGSYSYVSWYGPFGGGDLISGAYNTTAATYSCITPSATSMTYSFSLLFAGNPEGCFYVRLIPYGKTEPSLNLVARFAKAKNTITGRRVLLWYGYGSLNSRSVTPMYGCEYGLDGQLDKDSYGSSYIYFPVQMDHNIKAAALAGGKIPLVKCSNGLWEMECCYQYPVNFGFPNGAKNDSAMQFECSIGERKFLVTTSGLGSGNDYPNLGLIEV